MAPKLVEFPHRDFLGVPVTGVSLEKMLRMIDTAIANRQRLQHVSVNVAKFVLMRSDSVLDRDVRSSDIVGIDGMGILWAGRLLGLGLGVRVAGIDLMEGLFGLCADKGYRPYLLGARPSVLEAAVAKIEAMHPGLRLAGWHHGYFSADEESEIVRRINASRADCLFVGMPTPKKEHFLARHRDALDVPFVMGVGGSLDIWAGLVRRAPLVIQRLGLEWFFRMLQEPRRLGPRYLKTNLAFGFIIARALIVRPFAGKTRKMVDN
jgi:N-acetylglucosaminyldiphosphoundecaprenol N-acetyl-beta-D-mannosaminyltransferase